jgi:hypothetical protein
MSFFERRNTGADIFEHIARAPWQFGFVLTAFVFALLRWVLPFLLPNNTAWLPLRSIFSGFAPLSFVLLIPTAISFFRNSGSDLDKDLESDKQEDSEHDK